MTSKISYSKNFLALAASLSDDELKKIRFFITTAASKQESKLPGRNKPSNDVSSRHLNREKLVRFAEENKLWHYHTGHKNYNCKKPFGDWTSSHILHYQNFEASLKIVHYNSHPHFRMPEKSFLI